MLAHTIGVIGIVAGFGALALNIAAARAASTPRDSRTQRFLAIGASVLGLAVCAVTFFVGVEGPTVEGPVLTYGWPFVVATTDRFAGPREPAWIVGDLAFWLLAPQTLVYVYERFVRTSAGNSPRAKPTV